MQLDDFSFDLSPAQIAQFPPPERDGSRLMVLNRRDRSVETGIFPGIVDHFRSGDVLVINDTRVIPARLFGNKESGGKVEVFLVRRYGDPEDWICLTRSAKRPRTGSRLLLAGGIEGTVLEGGEAPYRLIRFSSPGEFRKSLEGAGRIPLPPYIQREDEPTDRERYQTVFARVPGAVAAPTAGLHFTDATFAQLHRRGVEVRSLTLHVGLGTFLPVRAESIREHRMHGEDFYISPETAAAVNQARKEGRRIFALGTTAARALETAAGEGGVITAGEGTSELFIYPGYRFRSVDALITNFHLPRSTLLMLVAAFAGREFVLAAYEQAAHAGFRFYSYGDCMLIV